MHSSKMRTIRSGSRLPGVVGGVLLEGVLPGECASQVVVLPRVCFLGGFLGRCASRVGASWGASQGGASQGGASQGCVLPRGVCFPGCVLPRGVCFSGMVS